jgi:predicted nucleic acid-binding protein
VQRLRTLLLVLDQAPRHSMLGVDKPQDRQVPPGPLEDWEQEVEHEIRTILDLGGEALRLNVPLMEPRIAAVALEHEGLVITRNRRDFGRVPCLSVEDRSV